MRCKLVNTYRGLYVAGAVIVWISNGRSLSADEPSPCELIVQFECWPHGGFLS